MDSDQDGWLLSGNEPGDGDPTVPLPQGTDEVGTSPTTQPVRRATRYLGPAGLLAAGLVAGLVGSFALGHHSSASDDGLSPTANQQQLGGGAFPPGLQNGGSTGGRTQPGGFGGEQRLVGTVVSVGSGTLTVTTSSGTQTWTVTSTSQVVDNGQLGSLSQVKKGDSVFAHVYPLNGKTVVERLFVGTFGRGGFQGGPGGFGGPPGGADDGSGGAPPGVING